MPDPHRESSTEQDSARSVSKLLMKPTAVLASNIGETVVWLQETFKIKRVDMARRTFHLEDGRILVIVSTFQDAYGREFCEYLKAPNYMTLEDVVRTRLR